MHLTQICVKCIILTSRNLSTDRLIRRSDRDPSIGFQSRGAYCVDRASVVIAIPVRSATSRASISQLFTILKENPRSFL
jgi:hypothetical protein